MCYENNSFDIEGVKVLCSKDVCSAKDLGFSLGASSCSAMEPPNKRHLGDSMNSAVLSFVERLSSRQRF